MKSIRIAILDDHAVVRHGLACHLAEVSGLTVIGAYKNSRELTRSMTANEIDILLLDYVLGHGELDGISLIRALHARFPDCQILVFSSRNDSTTVAATLQVGARGFISKEESLPRLVKAIRTVASGAIYLSERAHHEDNFSVQRNTASRVPRDGNQRAITLSAREQEVLRCYIDGMTITEIAEKFRRSIKTISTQKNSAFRKLGITSNKDLFKIMQAVE